VAAVTAPTWTILIPTLGQRRELLRRLLDGLMPQVDAAGGRVKVLAYWDNGEVSLAVKKQALVDACDTDYQCFVDDDDTVSDDYVDRILGAIESRPDYVGLKLMVYMNGAPFVLSHHSLRHGRWTNEGESYYRRDITCANPMRTDIARTARFDVVERGQPEDVPWVTQLRGRLKTEVFVDEVLYHYWWVPNQSAWQQPDKKIRRHDRLGQPWQPLAVESPHFAWHVASTITQEDRCPTS
jgi:hypothetical protein